MSIFSTTNVIPYIYPSSLFTTRYLMFFLSRARCFCAEKSSKLKAKGGCPADLGSRTARCLERRLKCGASVYKFSDNPIRASLSPDDPPQRSRSRFLHSSPLLSRLGFCGLPFRSRFPHCIIAIMSASAKIYVGSVVRALLSSFPLRIAFLPVLF